jgi:hypothetical protein
MERASAGARDEVHRRRADHFVNSSLREKVIEHLFVGELLRSLWRSGVRDFEVLRAEVDRAGYDLALECRDVFRHIQLKSSHRDAATRSVNVHLNLVAKPSGCVIWIAFDEATLELGPFYWLGSVPGMPLRELGERVARQNRPNLSGRRGERPDLRTVRRAQFKKLATLAS